MYRGTTPNIAITINGDIDLTAMSQIWVTFKSLSAEKTYDINDLTIDAEHKKVSLALTQEETLEFKTYGKSETEVKLQLRFLDNQGIALASSIAEVNLGDILKEGVIE